MRLPPQFWMKTLARLGLRACPTAPALASAASGRALPRQRKLRVESLESRAMLTGAAEFPLFTADVSSLPLATLPASLPDLVAPPADDDFVGDGSAGGDSFAWPHFFFADDYQAEGESSGTGSGGGSGSGSGGGGPCSDHTLTVENGTADEATEFLLGLSAAVTGECLIEGYDIDWGDGSSGYYTALDTLAHTYADDDPTATDADPYTVSVIAYWDDDASDANSATVTVSNLAPTAAGDSAETIADQSVTTANVLANATDPSSADTLSVVGVNTSGTLGQVTDNGDGTFTYDPSGAFDDLVGEETATDAFSYTLADDDTGTATGTVTITIHAAGCGPSTPRSVTVTGGTTNEGEAVSLGVSASGGSCIVSSFEVDWGDGTSDTYGAGDTPSHVYVDDNPTSTPSDPYVATATVHWTDGETASDSATITVNNVAPTVTIDDVPETINENETFTIHGTITDPGIEDTIESATLHIDLNFDGDTDDADERPSIALAAAGSGQWSFAHTTGVVLDDGATFDEETGARTWGNGSSSDTLGFTIEVVDDDSGSGYGGDTAEILNVAPTIPETPTTNFNVNEDGFVISATVSGAITDLGSVDFHRVTVAWGSAGSKEEELEPGELGFSITKLFDPALELEEADLYPLTAMVLDDDGGESGCEGGAGSECAETGRKVTALTANGVVWEGDTATFTSTLSSPTATPPESFTWEKQSKNSQGQYNGQPWTSLNTGFGSPGADVQSTFDEPFNGRVRVTLESGTTRSSAIISVRAKAAYPITFGKTAAGARAGDHLQIIYAWESSSTRLADLDGIEGGEFIWYTNNGLERWNNENLTLNLFTYHHPPFGFAPLDSNKYQQDDGNYITIPWTTGLAKDDHGQGLPVFDQIFGKETANQYYWYKITDGAFGDSKIKNNLGTHTITYWVFQQGGVWQYKIGSSD